MYQDQVVVLKLNNRFKCYFDVQLNQNKLFTEASKIVKILK